MEMILKGSKDKTLFMSNTGSTVTGFQIGDRHIIYPQQKVNINGKYKLRGGIPILFPWFGPPKDPEFEQNSRLRHGFIRNKEFRSYDGLSSSSRSETTMDLDYDGHLHAYPWKFKAETTAQFRSIKIPDGFRLTFRVLNTNPDVRHIPINPGFHPYFVTPEGITEIKFPGRALSFLASKEITEEDGTVVVKIPEESKGTVVAEIKGLGVVTLNLLNLKYVAFWTDSTEYICIEPIGTMPNDYNTDKGLYARYDFWHRSSMRISVDLE